MKRVTVYFEDEIHMSLKLKSAESGQSVSNLTNEAVRESFRANPPPSLKPVSLEKQAGQAADETQEEASSENLGFETVFDQLQEEGRIFD